MDEQLLRQTIANNLLYYRKKANLTQLELAEKLNCSDKSISKWERAEGVPDIYILNKIADLYKISIDNLVSNSIKRFTYNYNRNKDIVSFMSAGLVWLLAVIAFVLLKMICPLLGNGWLVFIYAIPLSTIILLIFNTICRRYIITFILISCLIWSIILSIYLSLDIINISLLFIIGIPLQIITILWFFLKRPTK